VNPYILPEGNVQIAFSGGRTSAYMLRKIMDANGGLPDRVEVTFQNTGREKPQTLDFVQEVGSRWGVNIVWLEYRAEKPLFEIVGPNSCSRNGEPFTALNKKKQAVPNIFQGFCSAQLKTLTAKRYLVSIGWRKWSSLVGFRADEMHRTAFEDNRGTSLFPLRAANVTKPDVLRWWAGQPFDLRLPTLPNGNTLGGNCDGCFKKSEAAIAQLWRDDPSAYAWWENEEARQGHTFSKRFSRAELRHVLERQGDWVFSDESFFCQANDGECTG
jgi:hypothetical protein